MKLFPKNHPDQVETMLAKLIFVAECRGICKVSSSRRVCTSQARKLDSKRTNMAAQRCELLISLGECKRGLDHFEKFVLAKPTEFLCTVKERLCAHLTP